MAAIRQARSVTMIAQGGALGSGVSGSPMRVPPLARGRNLAVGCHRSRSFSVSPDRSIAIRGQNGPCGSVVLESGGVEGCRARDPVVAGFPLGLRHVDRTGSRSTLV